MNENKKDQTSVFKEGEEAFLSGIKMNENPYIGDSTRELTWLQGYEFSMRKNTEKICSKCNIKKHLTDFNRDKNSNDGYRRYCTDCAKVYAEAYRSKLKKNVKKKKTTFDIIANEIVTIPLTDLRHWVLKFNKNNTYSLNNVTDKNMRKIDRDTFYDILNRLNEIDYKWYNDDSAFWINFFDYIDNPVIDIERYCNKYLGETEIENRKSQTKQKKNNIDLEYKWFESNRDKVLEECARIEGISSNEFMTIASDIQSGKYTESEKYKYVSFLIHYVILKQMSKN